MRATVLGPQRRPTVDRVVADVVPEGPIATVTAGWREREDDVTELDRLLGGRSVPLRLHSRWLNVLDHDPEYATAEREHRATLDELQALYVVQLDHALRALYETAQRGGRPEVRSAAVDDALAAVRLLDGRHLDRVRETHAEFAAAWAPASRPVMAAHRTTVGGLLNPAAALAIAGGHVGVLLHVLRLFDVAAVVPDVVIAWSAGAMALTERVVLFHHDASRGPGHSEVYDNGVALVRGVVLLPHARRRLHVDDLQRMSVLARRFAPAACIVLDDGVRLDLDPDGSLPVGTRRVEPDGTIGTVEGR
ncbi:MAG: hypothetical protein ICV70_03090 [Jiangellaceae bacterium]|nr:hypothetical protein [Jiangellaceae bacterium]